MKGWIDVRFLGAWAGGEEGRGGREGKRRGERGETGERRESESTCKCMIHVTIL